MNTLSKNIPSSLIENTLLHFGEEGKEWLEQLPNRIEEMSKKWSLQLLQPFPVLSFNFVHPVVRNDGQQLVLKLGVPCSELTNEMAALKQYQGIGSARIVDCDVEKGALLLERLFPATLLYQFEDEEKQVEVAVDTMKKLWQPAPANHSFRLLHDWLRGLRRVWKRFRQTTGPLPQELLTLAVGLSEELLASTTTPVLLHGDLHHFNILYSEERGWLAIDPKGIIGDPVFELCPFLRNPSGIFSAEELCQKLSHRIELCCAHTGFDKDRVLAWGFVEAMLSASWDVDSPSQSWKSSLKFAKCYQQMMT